MQSVKYKVNTKQSVTDRHSDSDRCEEATLLQLAKLGGYLGEQARSRLVMLHYGWIKSRCLQTLRDPTDANDAAQEAALNMFRALAKFQGRSALRTWLGTIVYNECMNVMRKRQSSVLGDHLEALLDIHQHQLLSEATVDPDAMSRVHQVLDVIPTKNREVLLLRFFKEMSLEEISVTLNLSLSATKMRLYRAMQQFRDSYSATLSTAL